MSLGAPLLRRFRLLVTRLRGVPSPARMGVSVGLGLFIGCLPVYGLHLPLCLLVCLPLRLDVVAAYLAANVSNPLFAPFILLAEVEIGSYLLTGAPVAFDADTARNVGVGGFFVQAALGSVVLGAVLGAAGGLIAARLARRGAASPLDVAIERTLKRYEGAKRGDRFYVASKLRIDPVLEHVAALGPLGRVLDAGSGRGQLGLCLLELGHAGRLRGFDCDARKVAVARSAARTDAEFRPGDLVTDPLLDADTILLIDVLHYLPLATQHAVLARAVAALPTGGRLVVREVDGRRRWGGALTRLFERVATGTGYNDARAALHFLSFDDIVAALRRLNTDCRVAESSRGLPVSNAIVVAVKRPRND